MQTMKQKPGRGLDALFAERVEGWRVDYDSYRHWTTIPDADLADLVFTVPGSVFHGEQRIDDVPEFATDNGIAIAALIRFAEQHGCMWQLWQIPTHIAAALPVDDRYGCTIRGGDLAYEDISYDLCRTGESPAHAAVLVMLDAVALGRRDGSTAHFLRL